MTQSLRSYLEDSEGDTVHGTLLTSKPQTHEDSWDHGVYARAMLEARDSLIDMDVHLEAACSTYSDGAYGEAMKRIEACRVAVSQFVAQLDRVDAALISLRDES